MDRVTRVQSQGGSVRRRFTRRDSFVAVIAEIGILDNYKKS